MIKQLSIIQTVFATLLVAILLNIQTAKTQTITPSLKEIFDDDFLIGTAIDAHQIEEKETAANRLIKQQFNSVTPENTMKAKIIEPAWNKFNFELADKLVAFALKNNIKVNAHTLICHEMQKLVTQKKL